MLFCVISTPRPDGPPTWPATRHRILNEWADMIPAHFDTYPLVDLEATKQMLAAQVAATQQGA